MNRLHRMLRAPLNALALTALAACTMPIEGQVNRYQGGEGQRTPTLEEGNKILAASLETTNFVHTRVNGLLLVQFDLVNKRTFPQAFQWTIEWFDRAGMKIDYGPQHWTPARLAGGAAQTVKAMAPVPEATNWRMQVGSRDEVH